MPNSRASLNKSNKSTSSFPKDGVQLVQQLVQQQIFESPIDLNLSCMINLEIPKLKWHHVDLMPKKMKVTNTGHTLILSGKWKQERPYISDGPFLGNYVFSQLHFHWGYNDMEGSEHTIDGSHTPLEMHVVLFKSCYLTQESALKKKDGIAVLAYFFKLQGADNPALQMLIDAIPYVQKPHSSARLDPLPLEFLVKPFIADYFLYWGSVTTSACIHSILWLLSREPVGVSVEQVDMFRTLLDINEEPLIRNYRQIQSTKDRPVFHVCPSTQLNSTLLSLRNIVKPSEGKPGKKPVASSSFESQKDVCAMQAYICNPYNPSNSTHVCNYCTCVIPNSGSRVYFKPQDFKRSNSGEKYRTYKIEQEDTIHNDKPTTACRARSVFIPYEKKRNKSSKR